MRSKITKRKDGTLLVEQFTVGESLTQQHFKDECDMDRIVASYKRNGIDIDSLHGYLDLAGAKFDDVSNLPSYQDAMQVIANAENAFSLLPADVRYRFGNDPGQFLEFAENPDNASMMVAMGLAHPEGSGGTTTPVSEAAEPAAADAPLPT